MSYAKNRSRNLAILAVSLMATLFGALALVYQRGATAEGGADLGLMALLLVAVVLAATMAWMYFQASRERVVDPQAEQNERNQQAILRLLDELSSLADGDLTVQATVSEDITGAIADSINYAVEALRELVITINESAILLDASTRQAEQTAGQFAAASDAQSKQVGAASAAISRMLSSIEEVAGDAERSSDVARHSVDVAHKGGEAVRRTIEGMNTIRETIQETSKRIKRLGESSQEIGNIVELINDIADQTNVLALNASIQASMAGEAGRGFAVVADEVQRLAERSANATKQIEVLVRTIQADTNEAIVSMDRSTTDVVGGALLAENAGAALEEIEHVSNQIATLVQNISSSAREQGRAASAVIQNVEMLQQINAQAASGASATRSSITKLAELASQLRRSVSGFRLPAARGTSRRLAAREPAVAEDGPVPEGGDFDESPIRFIDKKTA
jgi:twitching motility protein PilJ